jgi:hypothetical protein
MKIAHSIHKSFKYIEYSEGQKKIQLDIDRGDHDAYVYIPNLEVWDSKYEWAKGRRDEIVKTILEELREKDNYKYIVQEY